MVLPDTWEKHVRDGEARSPATHRDSVHRDSAHRGSVAQHAHGIDRATGIVLLCALGMLIGGIFSPAIEVGTFFFTSSYSILDGVLAFFEQGNYGLAVILLVFSVGFPVAKILFCVFVWWFTTPNQTWATRSIRTLAGLSKWSMLDVFLVAVMILVLEGSVLTASDVHLGLFLFAGAVVLSTYGARRVSLVLEQIRES